MAGINKKSIEEAFESTRLKRCYSWDDAYNCFDRLQLAEAEELKAACESAQRAREPFVKDPRHAANVLERHTAKAET